MTPDDVVRALWQRIEARDWPGLTALLHPDVVLEWPGSGESFKGPEQVVAISSEYPEGWRVEILRVLRDGDQVASEVRAKDGSGDFVATSFWTVRDGLVVDGREYWTTCVPV